MRNEFKIEFHRAVKSRGLLLSLIAGLLIVVCHFVWMVLPLKDNIMISNYPLSVFGKWIGGENSSVFPTLYYFTVPVLASLPFAGSYKEDIVSGYIKNVTTRISRKEYLKTKYIVTFLIGGIVSVFPMIVNFLLTAMVLPAILPQASTGYFPIFSYSMLGELFYSHPYIYLLIYMVINFIFLGLLSTLALVSAYICDNLFTTILSPFIIYLFVYAVTQLTNLHMLCPFGFLRPSQPIATNPFVLLGEIVLMSAMGGIYYYVGKRKDIY